MRVIKDIKYGYADEQVLDVHLPDCGEFPVFVYFHGGGLERGGKDVNFAKGLNDTGIAVVSAEYRKYPNAKYPDFLEDGASAVAWVKENMGAYGKVKNIYVGGSSAGGYISMMLCFDERYLAKHSMSNADIAGYFHDAGQPTTHFNVLRERGVDTRRVILDEAAPMFHVDGTKKYPPMEFVVSDNDMKNRLEQTKLFHKTLEHFEYDMENITLNIRENSAHCSYVRKEREDGSFVFADMVSDFIKRVEK